MLYFKVIANVVVGIQADEMPRNAAGFFDKDWTSRIDWRTFTEAQMIAKEATNFAGKLYIATDYGAGGWPRFDVIEAPKVGDKVSQSFNGDSYPRGEITHISKSLKKIVTSTGHIFWRRGNSGAWLVNGYASMIPGHVSERNPSF
jgi:hypothetical protein